MKKWMLALTTAVSLWAGAAVGAEDLYVAGLGTLSFSPAVHVTDGNGTAVEAMMRRGMASPQGIGTKRSELMHFLTAPKGMHLADGTADAPAAHMRLYQLVTRELRGTYTMMVFSFSGDVHEIFKKNRHQAEFWDKAFDPHMEGSLSLFGDKPPVTLDDFRNLASEAMGEGKGDSVDYRILDASPWKPFHNGDGTIRWQQNVKITVVNQEGLVVPMWIESVMYRNTGGRLYFLIFVGSHESGRVLSDDILYALHGLEREKV